MRSAALLAACVAVAMCACDRTDREASSPRLRDAGPQSHTPPMASARTTFGPTVAGQFYPANRSVLEETVRKDLAEGAKARSAIDPRERVVAIVSPHAGYVYSGPVAGWAFGALSGQDVRTAIVMGPNHRARATKVCSLDVEAYRTPLGDSPIDVDLNARIRNESAGLVAVRPEVFEPEHSVEVQIPFLQMALPNARIVPLVVPYMTDASFAQFAEVLFRLVGSDEHTVLVASSDLSHFFPYDTAVRLDDEILTWVERGDAAKLLEEHDARSGPCGVAPIVVAINYLKRFGTGTKTHRLRYQNSGDTPPPHGSKSRVVGYGALAMTVAKSGN